MKYSLEELKEKLGEPTKGFSRGSLFSREQKRRDHSLWSLKSSRSPNDELKCHFEEILDFLNVKKSQIFELRKNCEIDIFCLLSSDNGQGGTVIPFNIMQKLSDFQIDVVFDVYAEN